MNKTPAGLRAKAPLGDAALMGISTRRLKAQPGSLRRGLYWAVTGCAGSLGSYCHRSLRGSRRRVMCAPLGDDRRVGDDASFYPVPWRLTILISPPTPAPYRYTGLGLVRLIIRSSSGIRLHKQKAQR